jgi:RHS repeat-associated protein
VGGLLQLYDYGSSPPTTAKTFWPTYDGNGNVATLVNASSGAFGAVYEYDPFGNYIRAGVLDSTVQDNPFRFSTKYADVETGLVYYGNRFYSPALGRFVNRDPIEEAGGLNLYGFCGNDGVDNFDILGDSWLSKLWDRTVLSLGKHIAQNWDHGRQYVEMAVAIVASCFVGWEVAELVETEITAAEAGITFGEMSSIAATYGGIGTFASATGAITAGIAGGAAGGFVSGVSLGAMSGQPLGQALQSGLRGAEYGAIDGAISAGFNQLNSSFLTPKSLTADGGIRQDLKLVATRGLEGAAKSILENKNASSGFWSGVDAGIAAVPISAPLSWNPLEKGLATGLEQGVVGGLTSMNKEGKGFMKGFWAAGAKVGIGVLDKYYDTNVTSSWGRYPLRMATNALIQGSIGRFGGKTFSSGLFAGAESQVLNDTLGAMEHNPEKVGSGTGPVNYAFKLLTPKTSHGRTTLPLDSITGGYWALGSNWEQLY